MWSEIIIGITIASTMIGCKYLFERIVIPFLFDYSHSRENNKKIMWVRNKLLSPQMIQKYRYESDMIDAYAGYRFENGITWKE